MLKLPELQPAAKNGLVAIVGTGVALALGFAIPKEESGRTVKPSIAANGALQIKHIRGRQYLRAYLDTVGVATACDGLTRYNGRPIVLADQFSEAECSYLLEGELVRTATVVMGCTFGLALSANPNVEVGREGPRFAAVSLAYNIGPTAYCASTAAKRFNRFDYKGGCEAITWFNRAGGRVLAGLSARREREARVCREGLGVLL